MATICSSHLQCQGWGGATRICKASGGEGIWRTEVWLLTIERLEENRKGVVGVSSLNMDIPPTLHIVKSRAITWSSGSSNGRSSGIYKAARLRIVDGSLEFFEGKRSKSYVL